MSTVVNKSPRKGFTAIDNNAVRDNRLRLKTRGLLAYIMSLPPGWVLNLQWLQKQTGEGRESIQGCFKELSTYGYAKLLKSQNESGQFNGSRWTVTDVPGNFGEDQDAAESAVFGQNIESDQLSKRQPENPMAGKAVCVNNNKEYDKKEYKKEREREALSEKPQPIQEIPSQLKEEKSAAGRGQAAATYYEKAQYVTNGTESDAKEVAATAQDASVMPNSQREAYRTDSELRTIMAAYYKANPAEYTVGILNDAKGSRLTKEQITNCMVMWSSHMIENGKYNYSAHQLHQAFKRWVLRETQYVKQNPAAKAGPDAAPESVTLKTKNFNFQ